MTTATSSAVLKQTEVSRVSQIHLGDTRERVIAAIGTPVQTYAQPANQEILQYGSTAPSEADYIYLQDGVVVMRSTSYFGLDTPLSTYIQSHGLPSVSILQSTAPERDSLRLTVHVWSDKGLAVTSGESFITSVVQREDVFNPVSKETYFATWGKELVGHEEATVAATPFTASQTVAQKAPPADKTFFNNTTVSIAGFVILILIAIVVWKRITSRSSSEVK